jgi:hypothetical protein
VGRTLILIGIVLVILGLLITLGERLPIRFGRLLNNRATTEGRGSNSSKPAWTPRPPVALPGDIVIRGKNGAFYFPIVTCLLLSIVLSLVMWLMRRF